jgi:electron transfer flavoprotein alpha subunit
MSILAVLEQRSGQWNRMSFETLAAAQQMAKELGTTASAAVLGHGMEVRWRMNWPSKQLENLRRRARSAEGLHAGRVLRGARAAHRPSSPAIVLFPHTYQVRDFLPKLATRLGRVAVSDVVAHRVESGQLVLVRQLFRAR